MKRNLPAVLPAPTPPAVIPPRQLPAEQVKTQAQIARQARFAREAAEAMSALDDQGIGVSRSRDAFLDVGDYETNIRTSDDL